jgi:hypothetical protein
MKATQEQPPKVFMPVTVTLETQAEVDAIAALLQSTTHKFDALAGIDSPHMFNALRRFYNDANLERLELKKTTLINE